MQVVGGVGKRRSGKLSRASAGDDFRRRFFTAHRKKVRIAESFLRTVVVASCL
jgi:hypothetical protein